MQLIKIDGVFTIGTKRQKINGSFYIGDAPEVGVIGNNFTVSASADDGNIPENVRDEDFNTRWSAAGIGQTLTMALPDLYTVDSIQVATFNGAIRSTYFTLEHSVNGIEYFPIVGSFATSGTTILFENFTFPAVDARYIRYVGGGNSVNTWNSVTGIRLNYPDAVTEIVPPVDPPEELEYTNILYKSNWNDVAVGELTKAKFNSMFNDTAALKANNTAQVVNHDGYRCLGHFYGKDTYGQPCGMAEYRNLPNGTMEVWHGLHFKFQEGFVTPFSGKFWGATCGKFGEGGGFASGGQGPASAMAPISEGGADRGGNGRLMYDVPGFDPKFPNHSLATKLKFYVYHHNMTGKYGSDMGKGVFGLITPGSWQWIVIRQVMNTTDQSDGVMQVWLDGTLIGSTDQIRYTRPGITAQSFGYINIGTFSGGGDDRWDSVKDQWMYQRDMYIWTTNNPKGNGLYEASDVIPTPMGTING